VVLVSLSTATVVSLRQARRADEQARRADDQARRAQKRFDEVRRLANSMLFEVDGTIEKLEGATQARELIVRRALEYLDGLAGDAQGDAELGRELATAYVKTGEILGTTMGPNLGRPRDGLESYAKAQRILDDLVAGGHDDVATRWIRVRALFGLANLHRALGEAEPMRAAGRQAVAILAALPEDAAYDYRLAARGFAGLADMFSEDGDIEAAAHSAEAGLDVATRWERAAPSPEARYWIACGREAQGMSLEARGDPDGALQAFRQSIDVLKRLTAEHPEDSSYRRELWYVHGLAAVALNGAGDTRFWMPHVSDRGAAERDLRLGLPLAERMVSQDPGDTRAVLELVANLDELGSVVGASDPAAALPMFQRARGAFASLPPPARAAGYARQFERWGQCAMAVPLASQGHRAEALRAIDSGTAIAQQEASEPGAGLDARLAPWTCKFQAAEVWRLVGDDAAGAALLDETAAFLRPLVRSRPPTAVVYEGLVDTLERLSALRPGQRCALLDEAAMVWRSWPGSPSEHIRRRQVDLEAAAGACRRP